MTKKEKFPSVLEDGDMLHGYIFAQHEDEGTIIEAKDIIEADFQTGSIKYWIDRSKNLQGSVVGPWRPEWVKGFQPSIVGVDMARGPDQPGIYGFCTDTGLYEPGPPYWGDISATVINVSHSSDQDHTCEVCCGAGYVESAYQAGNGPLYEVCGNCGNPLGLLCP